MFKGLKLYWRRRGYRKQNGSRRRGRTERLGFITGRKRRLWWRLISKPKLKLKLREHNLKKFFGWLGDAYLNTMLKLANTNVMVGLGYRESISTRYAAFGKAPMKEYDNKKIVDIYRAFFVSQMVPMIPPPSAVVHRR